MCDVIKIRLKRRDKRRSGKEKRNGSFHIFMTLYSACVGVYPALASGVRDHELGRQTDFSPRLAGQLCIDAINLP